MPTQNIRKWSGTTMLREANNAAGMIYDTDDGLVKVLGDGTVRPLGFGVQAGSVYCVDHTNGSDAGHGKSWSMPKATIQAAVTAASPRDTILIRPAAVAAAGTDPHSYVETIIIPPTHFGLKLIGIGQGPTQGGLPQIRIGAGAVPMLTIRAAGCLVYGLAINGADATGGGILLDSDQSLGASATKDAFGTVIRGCFFKNCKGSGNASTGGAIYWPADGGSWQTRIEGNRFYQNRASIVLIGTSGDVLQDVAIVGNEFLASVKTNIDADILFSGGSGCVSLNIAENFFMCPDVPAYATSPAAARYVHLTGCTGAFFRNVFACTGKTFGANGDAAKIPTTVFLAQNYQEDALITRA